MMSSSNCIIHVILNIIKSPELLFYHEETGRAAIAEDRMGIVT